MPVMQTTTPFSKAMSSDGSVASLATLDFTPQPYTSRRSSVASPYTARHLQRHLAEPHFIRVAIGKVSDQHTRFGKLTLAISLNGGRSIKLYSQVKRVTSALSPRGGPNHIDINQAALLPFEGPKGVISFTLSRKRLGVADKTVGEAEVEISRDLSTGRFVAFIRSLPVYHARRGGHDYSSDGGKGSNVIAFIEVAVEVVQAPLSGPAIAHPLKLHKFQVPFDCTVPQHLTQLKEGEAAFSVPSLWLQGLSYNADIAEQSLHCLLSLDGGKTCVQGSRRVKVKPKRPLPLGGIKLIGTRDHFYLPHSGVGDLLTVDVCGESYSSHHRFVVGRSLIHLPANLAAAKQRRLPTPYTLYAPLMSLDENPRLLGMLRLNLVTRHKPVQLPIAIDKPTKSASRVPVFNVPMPTNGTATTASGPSSPRSPTARSVSICPSTSICLGSPKKVGFFSGQTEAPTASDTSGESEFTPSPRDPRDPLAISVGEVVGPDKIGLASICNALYESVGLREKKRRVANFAHYRSVRILTYAVRGVTPLGHRPFWMRPVDGNVTTKVGNKSRQTNVFICTDSKTAFGPFVEPADQTFPFVAERFIEFEFKAFKGDDAASLGSAAVDLVEVFTTSQSTTSKVICLPVRPV
eukprot:Blabericola_migrator_1__4386@NODE_2355_length_2892_cov_102_645310_g1474_i0_p1_GENE_NODE_2355_length_2892_cov_102_645310_g1474_i0NODE_2355_length_2892_cov_102_645310_g1474_i0_p1_ORF_typecomplete_len634_score82_80_NODE_2355_length_2892_cov_102_645310_g1474_i09132814